MSLEMDQLAATAIESFRSAEQLLADLLDFLPLVPENHVAWSPKCVTILLESCSQIDSLWKSELRMCHLSKYAELTSGGRRINIGDYRRAFRERVAWRKILLWSDHGVLLTPFAPWQSCEDATPTPALSWWEAYNNLKHDRLAARRDASVLKAADALGALWISIMNSELCADLILDSNLLSHDPLLLPRNESENNLDLLTLHRGVYGLEANTRLFTYPLVGGLDHARPVTITLKSASRGRFGRWRLRNA